MASPIRFVTTTDGVRIGYCIHGSGPPLLFIRGWISHLEGMWEMPRFRAYIEALAERFTVIRYDTRGQGMSDQRVDDPTLDDLVLDVEAVMDMLELDDAILYGQCFGGPIALAYTAKHPYHVSKLILDGTFAKGTGVDEDQEAFYRTIERFWPHSLSLLRQMTDPDEDLVAPDRQNIDWHRRALTAHMAGHLYRLAGSFDVRDLLPDVLNPALVVHRRRSALPMREAADLAARLRNAIFIALEGTALNPWEGDAQSVLDAIGDFLGVTLEMPRVEPPPAPSTPMAILFTDMESSTELTSRLGDEAAQQLVKTHDAVVREAIETFGGAEIKHTGDGIMAAFPSISASVDCAVKIQRGLRRHEAPFRVKIGIDAGEPLRIDNDLTGTVVQSARRIVDHAQPGRILVSDVVRRIVAGRAFPFHDLGPADLKGLPEPVRLFDVEWEPPSRAE